MPRPLKLPPERLSDLKEFSQLLAEDAPALAASLSGAKERPPVTPAQLRQTVAAALPKRSDEQIERAMRLLLVLCRQRLAHAWTGEDVVAAVSAGSREASEYITPIRAQLVEILSSTALLTFAKVMDLTYEHDNLFSRGRIITDIRPVFSEDATEILAAIITHTLTLGYLAEGEYRSLSIAMDAKDLQRLSEQCARAEKKAVRVQAQLQSGLTVGAALIAGQDEDETDEEEDEE